MLFPEQRAPDDPQPLNSSLADDSALVAAVLRKDRKATAQFVSRYADRIYGYMRSRLAPRQDDVEDLVQDVFVAAWESLDQFRGTGSLQGWLMGIARHKVEDHYRRRLRAPEPIELSEEDAAELISIPEFHQVIDQEQLRIRTERVLADLPELYRMALRWRYWEKASAREMASKIGKTEKAIERLLSRARLEFRERWNHGQFS